jgi:hypothetical protein
MARLIVHPGTPRAWNIQLKPGINYLGRAVADESKIEDASVSGVHCQILASDGWAMIKDLGSTNGTFVNGVPIQEAQLQPGQTLHLGGVALRFEDDSTAPNPPPPAPAVRAAAPVSPPPSTAPPAAVGPPAPRPAAVVSQPVVCRFHPHDPARWRCGRCGKAFCDLCVATRREAEGMKHFCRTCGVECSELEIQPVREERPGFFQVLPGALAYPFRKQGIFIFFVVGFLLVGCDFLASLSKYTRGSGDGDFMLRPYAFTAGLLRVLFWGYLFAYLQNLVQSTARGDESQPEMPAFGEFFSDLLVPFFQLAVLGAVCFGPAIALAVRGFGGEPAPLWVIVPLVAVGCLYFPMAFLAIALYDTVAAINPLLVVPSLLKVPLPYAIACVLFGTTLVCRWLFSVALLPAFPSEAIALVISGFLSLYLLTVEMRILGLLYWTNKDTFGWFQR